jgi:hypothetical protein
MNNLHINASSMRQRSGEIVRTYHGGGGRRRRRRLIE